MSPPHYYLAFDLGASSGRALLGFLDEEVLTMEEVHRFETPLIEDGERLFWDLEALEDALLEGLRAGLSAAPTLRSCSVDSWAVDYVPLGADGEPLRDPYCYRDPRTQEVMEKAVRRVERERIYSTTGIQFIPINTLYQVLADQRMEPETVEDTARRLPIADYFQYRLSGRPVAELSMASTTQLMNVRTHEWAHNLMQEFAIDPETWPEIVPPATRLGSLRSGGLPDREASVEVVAGCSHDTACAVAAVPAVDDGGPWAYLSCGTWSLLGVEREAPLLSDAAREASFTNEIGLNGTVRFLKNLTGLWVLQECERAWKAEGQSFDYETFQREARASSFGGEHLDLDEQQFLERGRMPEKIQNYCHEQGWPVPEKRGDFVRLILKSLAADYRDKLAIMEDLIDESIEVVHVVGGGARNDLLCQWTADATGTRVVAGPAEATAWGNLLIQARTMGGLPDGASIRDVVRASTDLHTYHPE
jgi:rhamnulokinase